MKRLLGAPWLVCFLCIQAFGLLAYLVRPPMTTVSIGVHLLNILMSFLLWYWLGVLLGVVPALRRPMALLSPVLVVLIATEFDDYWSEAPESERDEILRFIDSSGRLKNVYNAWGG